MAVRILLAEDHQIVREGLRAMINEQDGFEVVAEAPDGLEAIRLVGEKQPDLVVMDLSMPKCNGIVATRKIVADYPGVKVLALSMHADSAYLAEALDAGASGFLVKHGGFSELVTAIQAVIEGRMYLSPHIAAAVVEGFLVQLDRSKEPDHVALTPTEQKVLQLLAEGKASKEIASVLNIEATTVDSHRRQLKKKLNVNSIASLVKYAISKGLTSLDG